tara:strand:- start:1863 stop:3026 length:1164 start_codon:yes stop_codon:yes gene_type:complete
MNRYTPLYGNPLGAEDHADRLFGLGSEDHADRLFGTLRADVVSGMHSNPVEVPDVVSEAELGQVWNAIGQLLKDKYGVDLTIEVFNSADSDDMNLYLQTLVDQEAQILGDDDLLEAYVDELAEVLNLEHAGEGVQDIDDLDDDSRTFDLAIASVNECFPNASDINDMVATVANALDAMETDLETFAEPVEVIGAINKFKSLGFPSYAPEELVELIYLTATNEGILIEAETESMLTDNSRNDAICSNDANNIILAEFGADAAAKHAQFCGLSGTERINAYNAVQGNLATLFGIPQSDWNNFVLKSVEGLITPELLADGGAALRSEIGTVIERASKDPKNALKMNTNTSIGGSQATSSPMSTTSKVVTGLSVVGALIGSLYFIKKVREF